MRSNMYLIRIVEWNETVPNNFPEFKKNMSLQNKEAYQILNKRNKRSSKEQTRGLIPGLELLHAVGMAKAKCTWVVTDARRKPVSSKC